MIDLDSNQRDFEFNDRDFRRVCELIHARAGIALAPAKRDMVYGRLSRRLRNLGLHSFKDYLDQLEQHGGEVPAARRREPPGVLVDEVPGRFQRAKVDRVLVDVLNGLAHALGGFEVAPVLDPVQAADDLGRRDLMRE